MGTTMRRISWIAALAALTTAGCVSQQPPAQLPEPLTGQLYTLTNLHPDEASGRMYSLNYQQVGLVPMCTPVTVNAFDERQLTFTVDESRRRYVYYFDDTMVRSHADHISMYFGRECTRPEPGPFTDEELAAISAGKVVEGMSKAAVVYAIGYPPGHATPNLDVDEWSYWKSRHDRIAVTFDQGRVVNVRD